MRFSRSSFRPIGPTEGKVDAGRIEVDAEPPGACLLQPRLLVLAHRQRVVVLAELVRLAGPGAGRADGDGAVVRDGRGEAEGVAEQDADLPARLAFPVDVTGDDVRPRLAALGDGQGRGHDDVVAHLVLGVRVDRVLSIGRRLRAQVDPAVVVVAVIARLSGLGNGPGRVFGDRVAEQGLPGRRLERLQVDVDAFGAFIR